MTKWEKILFWLLTAIIVVDNIYWQWAIKITVEPSFPPLGGILGSMIGDVIVLAIWLALIVKLYRRANKKS